MPDWVNFKEIRERVSLEDVLFRYYKIESLTRQPALSAGSGGKVVGPCPVHGGDSPRAFNADLSRNLWHCFSRCKGGGNQIDFVAKKEGISIREAALRLQAFFLVGGQPPRVAPSAAATPSSGGSPLPRGADADHGADAISDGGASRSKLEADRGSRVPSASATPLAPRAPPASTASASSPPPEKTPPLGVRLNLKREHPHLITERGIKVETLETFDVGYCSKGIMRGLVCFPIHDEEGQLVAYAGRRLRPTDIATYGKYKFPKGFRKELVLYNLHRVQEQMKTDGVILVEGFFSVLALHQAGLTNVVAAMGSELSHHQAELLASASDVIVLFDGDPAGNAGADLARDRLAAQGTVVRVARLPEGTQPDALSPKALRWLLNGMRALDLAEVSFWVRPGR